VIRRAVILVSIAWVVAASASPAAAPPAAPAIHVPAAGSGLSFDFPGLEVGTAEYEDGPTGTTVLYFPKHALVAIDVRGGAPGTINSDAARLEADEGFISAVVLSGGSAYGLSAATGVANALKDRSPDPGHWRNVAVAVGAIIFDLGDRRYNAVTPDDALGRAALKAARAGWVPLGAHGAGRFAMQGGYFDRQHSGQGAAFKQAGETKVLVITVVNAIGSIVDRSGRLLRCSQPVDGKCPAIADKLAAHLTALGVAKTADARAAAGGGLTANTTITAVVTNQAMPYHALQRLAIQVHNSMARAIQPFGTRVDGDTLFAITTAEVKNPALDPILVSTLASEAAWDAILASAPVLPERTPRSGEKPTPALLGAFAGRYELVPGVTAEVRRHGDALEIEVTGRESLYLPAGKPVALEPVTASEFELGTPRADRLRIDRDARGKVEGFTINPGPWPIRARRLPPG
jgi:L-aminopeptidase/D-esterase-like protein